MKSGQFPSTTGSTDLTLGAERFAKYFDTYLGMAAIDKVKVLIVGDSGVGKTTLTHLITQNEPLVSPSWTIGCAVEVKLHKYKEGTQAQNTFFVELWDVGGSVNHRNTRNVFYQPTHGIILVHDLTNRKSQLNLHKWLAEVVNRDVEGGCDGEFDVDPEQLVGSTQTPIFVVGTKWDLAEEKQKNNQYRRMNCSIAEQYGADEIYVNCHQSRSLAPGTTSAVKLCRFFDKVIEKRYYSRDGNNPFGERKRQTIYSTPITPPSNTAYPAHYMSPKFYHMD